MEKSSVEARTISEHAEEAKKRCLQQACGTSISMSAGTMSCISHHDHDGRPMCDSNSAHYSVPAWAPFTEKRPSRPTEKHAANCFQESASVWISHCASAIFKNLIEKA